MAKIASSGTLSRPVGIGFVGLLLALIFAVAGVQVWQIYEQVVDEARRQIVIEAEVAAAFVAQIFGAASLALRSIDGDPSTSAIVVRGEPAEIHVALKRAQASMSQMRGLALVGVDGRIAVNVDSETPPRTDLSDRAYFIAHRDTPSSDLRIDRPIVARPRNDISIPVSMRVERPDGSFGGIVAARLDPARFAQFFSKLDADAISLVDGEGHLHARYPEIDLLAANPSPPPDADLVGAARFQITRTTAETRLFSAARVPGTELFVLASNPRSAILDRWFERATGPVLAAVVAGLVALAVAAALSRRSRQMASLAARHEADEKAARQEAIHFRDVARNKSDFLAHLGHEIRTPLNAIIGFSEIIAADAMKLGGPARYRDYAGDIRFSAEHLLEVINRILDMSKIEAGKWRLDVGRVDAASLLSTVRHLAEQRATKEGVTLEIADGGAGIEFAGDERVLVQLLLNLTINAIKFAGEDRRVLLGCVRRADGAVEFRVTDRGRGMSPEDAARALRPFETAHDEEARRRSDTGLGLPLARMFAELHDGMLTIDTAPGKGTVVRVVLPPTTPEASRA
jgi:signal transduction histidine kinase